MAQKRPEFDGFTLYPGVQAFGEQGGELTSSFALTLQIQRIIARIIARSLRRRRLSVATVIAHVSAVCSITLRIGCLIRRHVKQVQPSDEHKEL